MSYQVLARKYRPQSFADVLGQEAVVRTLSNIILQNRTHHAYLFTGVRGTGKTSLARIFAKSLNCQKGPSLEPCQQCNNCKEISIGQSVDVLEIDGASNTSVDHVRELREQIKYVPLSARFKMVLIDEVHMLSTSAFNALLKTLEEPPSHVIFIFATTDFQKIPATILSRCQRFDLKRIPITLIEQSLKIICESELVQYEESAIKLLARMSSGSLRDAQSLLDQAIAFTKAQLKEEPLLEMLGLSSFTYLTQFCEGILQQSSQNLLELVSQIYNQGIDIKGFVESFMEFLRNLYIYKSTQQTQFLNEYSEVYVEKLKDLSAALSLSQIDLLFSLTLHHLNLMNQFEQHKMLLEVFALRAAQWQQICPVDQLLGQTEAVQNSETLPLKTVLPGVIKPTVQKQETSQASSLEQLRDFLKEQEPRLFALMQEAKLWAKSNKNFALYFNQENLVKDLIRDRIAELAKKISDYWGFACEVMMIDAFDKKEWDEVLVFSKEEVKRTEDPIVEQAIEILDAQIV